MLKLVPCWHPHETRAAVQTGNFQPDVSFHGQTSQNWPLLFRRSCASPYRKWITAHSSATNSIFQTLSGKLDSWDRTAAYCKHSSAKSPCQAPLSTPWKAAIRSFHHMQHGCCHFVHNEQRPHQSSNKLTAVPDWLAVLHFYGKLPAENESHSLPEQEPALRGLQIYFPSVIFLLSFKCRGCR